MILSHIYLYFTGMLFWIIQKSSCLMLPSATELLYPSNSTETDLQFSSFFGLGVPRNRRKRYISPRDMNLILDYHNRIRSKVFPPAANMEYMVWDERLARSAEAWATQCVWEHGPTQLLRHIGQNLSVHSGRYRTIVDLVKPWYEEKQYYSFPYPQECNPRCPSKCSGAVCTHYTQMVWATSNRIGCAVNTCSNINVWGNTWRQAVYLVCNYAIKGNWIGEAPYKLGRPCSACPPSYGGSCSNNMCFPGIRSNKLHWF
ncbi:peptidase inhibitor R3HDML [Latimeria chalumnae]|uniref:R3H domain containing like n=1 Tax=Latimeria chalumnae TaxID=7897 RepID=H3AYW9_LATCH|nr:PREDICTED: peptidase inhibitor R3HDML [Latimeria chalumnae]|eukprot:XP_006000544.1 PREDICTED: peptidase inhibitor R3HDML [Latimeria chalumnae]